MFRNRPDIVTKGRYVFAPAGTPASPVPTWLWARQWINGDIPEDTPLGQIIEPYRFYSGEGPVIHPPAKVIGRRECLEQGETPGDLTPGLVDGFDVRCWLTNPDTSLPLILSLDVTQNEHQLALGRIQQQLYLNATVAATMLTQLLGPGSTVATVPNSASLIPGSLVGTQGDLTVVIVSGTGNPQQLALQGLLGLAGPVNQGTYSTVPLWQLASLEVQERVRVSPAVQTGRIVVVGHSYGGAVATILTARYLQENPNRDVQLLTWGCPLPGDERLILLTARAKSINLVDDGDVVSALPPTGSVLEGLSWLLPKEIRFGWGQWRYPLRRVGLSVTGERRSSPNPNDVLGIALSVVRQAILREQIPTITAHDMAEYLRRMGGGDFPVPDVLTGSIIDWPKAFTPAGYLPCDGAAVSRTTYADLFALIGTDFGPGDGVDTFNVPDCRSRVRVGNGQGPGLTLRVMAQQFGAETVALATGQLPAHNHGVTDTGHNHGVTDTGHNHNTQTALAGGAVTQMATAALRLGLSPVLNNFTTSNTTGVIVNNNTTGITVNNTGSGDPVDTVPPSLVVHTIIKT